MTNNTPIILRDEETKDEEYEPIEEKQSAKIIEEPN